MMLYCARGNRRDSEATRGGNLPLTRQVLVSTWLVPLAPHLHQLVAHGVLLLFGFVGVQLPVGFRVRLWVRVRRVWDEGVRRVRWRLGSAVHWGHDGGPLVAVDAEAALAWHLDQLWRRTGRGRQGHVAGAKGNAAHCPVDAGALVFATGAEVLAILVDPPVIFARASLGLR